MKRVILSAIFLDNKHKIWYFNLFMSLVLIMNND